MKQNKLKLIKGTRLISLTFISVSILIAAGVLFAANMYYDIDSQKIIVEEVQDIVSTAAYQFKVAYDASNYLTASVSSTGTTTLEATGGLDLIAATGLDLTAAAASTWKTTDGNLTIQTEGTGDDIFIIADGIIDLDATTLNLDASSSINIGTNADVPFDIDTAALDIDSSGNINITSTGITTLEATGGLNLTAGAVSTWKTTDGNLTIQTEGSGDDIFIIAYDVFDLDSTTLNLDASSFINIGTNADVPFDIDTSTLTIDSSGNIVITTAASQSIALTSGDDFTITFDADDAFSLLGGAVEYLGVANDNTVTLSDDTVATNIDGSTITLSGNSQVDGTLTVGANTAGYAVTFYGDTDTNKMVWDDSSNKLTITGTAASDAFVIASGDANVQGNITVGTDGTGYDLLLYGDTAGAKMKWDQANDKLEVTGVSGAEALNIIVGDMAISAGNLSITNPVSLGQVALTVTQSTTSNDIIQFIGQAAQTLSLGLDGDGNLILTSDTKLTITAGNNDIVLDTGSGTLRVPSGRITVAGDAVLTEPGQEVLRGMIPIFGFDLPAQTASESYVTVSRIIEDYAFPAVASGTTRVHKFVIRYGDDIATDASSTWQVYTSSEYSTFTIPGCNSTSTQGKAYIASSTIPVDSTDWQLKVKTPTAPTTIRIFQIFLAAYDKMPE